MAEESSNECMPLDLSLKDKATPSTSRDGTQGTSSTLGPYTTTSDDALRDQRNTQPRPLTDGICNVDGVTDNGSRSFQPLWSIRSIDNIRPSTSRAGMEEASANFEDGATNATGTGEREQRVSCGVSGKVSSRQDISHGQSNEHTGDTAPTFRARDLSSVKRSSHKCETCGKLLSRGYGLIAHYRTHTRERPYKCAMCEKSFADKSNFRRHLQIHTDLKPHICQNCTKQFKLKEDLKSHLKTHSNDRPCVCDICNLSYKRRSDLLRHRKEVHEGKMAYNASSVDFGPQ
nr:zinc finger protein 271-like [Dermacentor andersoni]